MYKSNNIQICILNSDNYKYIFNRGDDIDYLVYVYGKNIRKIYVCGYLEYLRILQKQQMQKPVIKLANKLERESII